MSKICYKKRRFSRSSFKMIQKVNQIISDHKEKGSRPTTLKIFHRMIKDGDITDCSQDYNRLSFNIVNARNAGIIGWEDMEGRKQTHKGDVEI